MAIFSNQLQPSRQRRLSRPSPKKKKPCSENAAHGRSAGRMTRGSPSFARFFSFGVRPSSRRQQTP